MPFAKYAAAGCTGVLQAAQVLSRGRIVGVNGFDTFGPRLAIALKSEFPLQIGVAFCDEILRLTGTECELTWGDELPVGCDQANPGSLVVG